MEKSVEIYPTAYELAEKFAEELAGLITESAKKKRKLTVALSGGSTPELLFSILGDHFSQSVPWEYVHFFWGDERCVPPDDPDSNYGMTRRDLFNKIDIPPANIHRIRGEDDPGKEVLRYSAEISEFTLSREGIPRFDLIILGLGEDGHTASIFPGQEGLLRSDKICELACHPFSGQNRITITGRVINNAESVVFMVTGNKKAQIVEKIINKNPLSGNFPASHIGPSSGMLRWLLDDESGSML